MKGLVQALENENINVELYLNQINSLSDKEIEDLFDLENISEEMKDKLLIYAWERINRLSTKSFIKVSSWASNVEGYKKNYFSKIEEMTYEEFLDLIYRGIYKPSILLEIVKTDTYKKYLQQEKEEQKVYDLQCCDIQIKLDAFSSVEELDSIGRELLNIIKVTPKTKNIEVMEYVYLRMLIENIDFLALDSDAIKIGLELMTMQMRNCQVLTNKMIEFYLYYRIKGLNLENMCQHVFVSTEKEPTIFGYFTNERNGLKEGTLKIFSNYLPNCFAKYKKECNENAVNIHINAHYIFSLSHELAHALKDQKYLKSIENLNGTQYLEKIWTNKELNYYLRNSALHCKIGHKEYMKYHDIFINEVWADIFAIFDSNKQWLTNFKGSVFIKDILENFIMAYAQMLVSFYTKEDGTMLSPMEKFDAFYLENIGDEKEPIVQDENPDIMGSLMMGDKIPLDVFHFLQKIANGEIKTIDLYQTLTTYLQNRTELSTNSLEKETEEQAPTL